MNKIITLGTLFSASILLSSCSTTVSMFPTGGPIKEKFSNTVLVANVENITSNSGPFSVQYPSGDLCEGRWASLAPQMTVTSWGSLFSKYGSANGINVSTVNKPGINRGEAMAVCKSGNQVKVEFFTGSGTASGLGLAEDTNGNSFKLIF